jgi:succinate dehydrogenase assembly factor 1
MPKHSQIQLQILSLYKQFLKLSKDKPGLREVIRSEFRKNAKLSRTDTLRIEYQYRLGKKQLDTLKNSEVDSVGVFESEK